MEILLVWMRTLKYLWGYCGDIVLPALQYLPVFFQHVVISFGGFIEDLTARPASVLVMDHCELLILLLLLEVGIELLEVLRSLQVLLLDVKSLG